MASNKQIRREIYITANGKAAQDVLKALGQYAADLDAQIKKLVADGKANTKEHQQLVTVQKKLSEQMKANISNTEKIDMVMKNLAGSTTRQLRDALKAVRQEISYTSESSGKLEGLRAKMAAIQQQIDKNTGSLKKQNDSWSTAFKNLTAYVGLFAVFKQLKTLITGVITKNLEMSDSLANIRKVSMLAMNDINKMTESMAKWDTRTPLQELNQIAYAGAKLGIGEYGVEALESFVRASNMVNVALKEDLGEEALTALSKITQVMGLIPKMGVEQSMLKTGSAIFRLASTSTATSGKIIDFSNRLLSMGKQGALATADILALGAAVDSMALEPEVASTAFAKLITEVRKGASSIEHDLGITSGALKQLFETGRGMDALIMIFEKMHSSGNVFALDKLFKDLGSDGARLVKTMVTMADKVDMLKTAVATANDAFVEGTAITQEYKIQQETAKGILERANNMWNKAFVNPEGIDMVKQLAQQWYNMSKAMTSSKITITGLKTVLEMLVFSMKTFVSLLPAFVGFFLGRTISQAVIGIGSLVKAVWAAVTAQRALNAAMSANAVGAVVSALAMLVTWLQSLADSEDKAKLGMDKFSKSLKSAKGEVGAAIVELDQYKKAIDTANVGSKQRAAAIKNFNDKFGSYISNLITEKSSVQDIAKAYREASAAIEKKIMAQNKEKDLAQHVAPRADREAQLLYEYDEMAKSGSNAAFNGRWLKAYVDDNLRTKGFHATVTELMKRSGVGTSHAFSDDRNYKALWNAIYNSNGDVGETFAGYRMGDTRKRFNIQYTDGERQTAMAVAYIRQRAAREQALDEVNKKYALYPDFELREDVSPVFIADGDGDKGSKSTKATNPNASAQNIAKTRANALISNIKAFYEEQQRKYLEWVVEMNKDGERVSEGQQTAELNAIEQRMNAALGAARQSIATLDSGWQEFLATMDSDIKIQADDTSSQLLEAIKSANVTELNTLLGKLSSDISKENNRSLSENLGALLDEIFAKGSANLRKKAEEQLKHQRSIQRILSSNDYTGSVDRSTRSNMETAGLLPKAASVDATTAEGLSVLNTSFDALTAKTRDYAAELYRINPASATFREDFLAFLSVAKEGFDFAKLTGSELSALYIELARYLEEYSAAQKKEYDNRKKLSDNDWKWKGRDNRQEYVSNTLSEVNNGTYRFRRAAQGEDHTSERSGIMGGNRFLDQFSYNANLESGRAEILLLQEKIEWMKQYKLASSEIAEQEAALAQKQDAYISALMQTMKERMDAIYSLHQPIMDFGTAAGEAFATMTQDAEAGRDALKAAVGDMIKSMMKQTVAMTEEYIKRRMMQKVNDRLVSVQLKKSGKEQEAQEQANNAISTGLQEAAGQAKLDITKDVGSEVVKATVVQNETIANSAAQTAQSEVSSNAAATEANVGLGIASGAAKTIGSLGWWGIPLIAVITAALNALLGFAMGKVSSLFGGGKKKDVATSNVKLTSGMLTYDQGNLQSLPSLRRYQAYDSGNMGELKPFTDTNGKVYWAEEGSIPLSGVSLLTRPTATTVNGQPSIVAENGPELVIGRETTKAMMMNNPDLLRMLLQYNSNHSGRRAYDTGNLPSLSDASAAPSSLSPEISSLLSDMQQTNTALLRVVGTLTAQLNKPLKAAVDMWGHEGLYESLKKGEQFMKGKG